MLGLLADGARNSEIARQLGMTDKTVRNHVSAILMKLQVTDRTAAHQGPRRALAEPNGPGSCAPGRTRPFS